MGIKTAFKKVMVDFMRWVGRNDNDDMFEHDTKVPMRSNAKRATGLQIPSSFGDGEDGLTLTVYSATGGKIIRVSWYDRKTDRSGSALHIITQEEDLGEELAQIITRESLTR